MNDLINIIALFPSKQVVSSPGVAQAIEYPEPGVGQSIGGFRRIFRAFQRAEQSPLDAALGLAAEGWPVFPCRHDKIPLTDAWTTKATCDPARIRLWWMTNQDACVAVRTGQHLLVLDLDGEEGRASFQRLEAELGELPYTRQASTPDNGVHLWFAVSPKIDFRNSVGKLAKGIDVRANGGYVVTHGHGSYFKNKRLVEGNWLIQTDDPPARLPAAWQSAILKAGRKGNGTGGLNIVRPTFDAGAALRRVQSREAWHDDVLRITARLVAQGWGTTTSTGCVPVCVGRSIRRSSTSAKFRR